MVRPKVLRALIVEDNPALRLVLRTILRHHPDIEVIGEAQNGAEACSCVEKLQPALILMDINMPKMNGIEATRWIKTRYPDVVVLGLTVNDDEATMAHMREAGAAAVINKELVVDDLYPAINKAVRTVLHFGDGLAEEVSMSRTHAVHFYHDSLGLLERMVAYTEAGLHSGSSVILVSSTPLLGQLKSRWLPLYENQLVSFDAEKTLSSFMIGGRPDRDRFMETFIRYVRAAAKTSQKVFVLGDMVSLLIDEGRYDAVLELEALWNEVSTIYPVTQLCLYPATSLTLADERTKLRIFSSHSRIVEPHDHLSAPAI